MRGSRRMSFTRPFKFPKFHDFTGPKEELIIDPEAWFNGTSPCSSLNLGLTSHPPICPFVNLFPFDEIFFQGSSTCVCAGVIKKNVVAATATEVVFSSLQNCKIHKVPDLSV